MRVICVKWGDKYGSEYVTRLQSMVACHLPVNHEFVCLTDRPVEGVKCLAFESNLPTWWSKLEMFKPGRFSGENLYFDLDIVAKDDLSVFRRPKDGKLWALDDFSYSLRTPRRGLDEDMLRKLGGIGTCNSSIMSWHDDAGRVAWETVTPEVMDRLHGDQNHITQALWPHSLSLYPSGLACSYKYHVLRNEEFGSVVVFHGEPKVPQLPRSHALRKLWEAAA